MSSSIAALKQIIALEEERYALSIDLDTLDGIISELKRALLAGSPSPVAAPAAMKRGPKPKAEKVVKAPKTGKRAKRGSLSEGLLEALKAAGSTGSSVKELAAKLGANYRNISVWFSTTGKKNKAIKKIGRGMYRLVG